MPSQEDGQDQEESHHLPCHYRGIGVAVVNTMFLLSPMDIEVHFPFLNFLHLDLLLVSHRPDHVDELGPFGDLVDRYGFVVAHPFMAVKLNPDCLDELVLVMGFHCLVLVQYVQVVGGHKGNQILESLLDCIWCSLKDMLINQ